MKVAVILLIALASAPKELDEHQRLMAIHHEWQSIHESAQKKGSPARALLVFDPRKEAVWIERDGKVDSRDVQPLPAGLEWSAYIVTSQGLAPVAFPVRINRPRKDVQKQADAEQIVIIGLGKDRHCQFDISATSEGHGFHIGSGASNSFSITIALPKANAEATPDKTASILESAPSDKRKWSDSIRTERYSIDVVRVKDRED